MDKVKKKYKRGEWVPLEDRPLTTQVRDLKRELKEVKEQRNNCHTEVKGLEQKNQTLHNRILAQLQSCITERIDLLSRIARLDARIENLGFNVISATQFYMNVNNVNQKKENS